MFLMSVLSVLVTMLFVCLFIKFDQKKKLTSSKIKTLALIAAVSIVVWLLPSIIPPFIVIAALIAGQSFWYFKTAKDITIGASVKIFLFSNLASWFIFGFLIHKAGL